MFYSISALVTLFGFWLLLSGYFTPFFLATGLASAVAVLFVSRRMDIVDHEGHPAKIGVRALLTYWPWLFKQVALSGWDVTWRILHPKLPIDPSLVRFKPSQRTEMGLVIHSNSITLTPGTVSIEVQTEEFLVHALTAESAQGLAGSEMDRRVSALERLS
jgi:multicomponent Na+:H+ antiporter subunit E